MGVDKGAHDEPWLLLHLLVEVPDQVNCLLFIDHISATNAGAGGRSGVSWIAVVRFRPDPAVKAEVIEHIGLFIYALSFRYWFTISGVVGQEPIVGAGNGDVPI